MYSTSYPGQGHCNVMWKSTFATDLGSSEGVAGWTKMRFLSVVDVQLPQQLQCKKVKNAQVQFCMIIESTLQIANGSIHVNFIPRGTNNKNYFKNIRYLFSQPIHYVTIPQLQEPILELALHFTLFRLRSFVFTSFDSSSASDFHCCS